MHATELLSPHDLELLRLQAHNLLKKPRPGSSQLSGSQRSWQRGMGMELEELRPYQIGDDVRHIAWRTSARSHRPITKVFRAERLQRVLLMVEQHPGMTFATRGELKAATAVRATAVIAFAALKQRAEVGALISGQQHFAYSNQLDRTLDLLRAVNTVPAEQPTPDLYDLNNTLTQAQRLSRRGDNLYIISDFSHWNETQRAALSQLAETRPLYALQIIDKGELTLPAIGKLRLRSPFDGRDVIIDSDNKALRRQYAEAMTAKQQGLESLLRRSGVIHHRLYTDEDLLKTLATVL